SLPEVGLPAGIYYIRVAAYQSPHTDVNYNLKAGFTASSAYEKEANGTRTSATPIKANAAYKGGIFGGSDDKDYYKIVLAKNDTVRIRFAHPLMTTDYEYWRICLLNAAEEIIQIGGLYTYPIPGDQAEVTLPAVDLSAGTYYILITSGYSYYYSDLIYPLTVNAPNNGTAGWKHNSTGWWYQRADGTYPVNQWEKINGKWYHFDGKGYMQTGWQKFGTVWYYLGTDGAMKTGWQKISDKWYYFASSGAMQTGWQKISDKWYYFESGGAMVTGWKQLSGKWYYFESSGAMVTGWKTLAGTTYYFKSSGAMAAKEWCSGWWLNADGSWTYKYKASWTKNAKGWWFGDTSGWYAKNVTLTIDDKKYTFDANGYWVK
ncbi:MAG: N-acetylmuramoyl-L-alanine amidase family protein, partial [Lachnospiraceae bacterium]|nr:N-acetylmuramoyl-L-alanine amidase family protein [Lachnospiraceae bacterium]